MALFVVWPFVGAHASRRYIVVTKKCYRPARGREPRRLLDSGITYSGSARRATRDTYTGRDADGAMARGNEEFFTWSHLEKGFVF